LCHGRTDGFDQAVVGRGVALSSVAAGGGGSAADSVLWNVVRGVGRSAAAAAIVAASDASISSTPSHVVVSAVHAIVVTSLTFAMHPYHAPT